MVSSAFALFSSSWNTDFTMEAAKWNVAIETPGGDWISRSTEYKCPETENEIHEFILTRTGSATSGYCEIIIDGAQGIAKHYTGAFEDEMKVKIQAVAGTKVQFVPRWGKPADYGHKEVYRSGVLYYSHTEPPPPEDTSSGGEGGAGVTSGDGATTSSGGESGGSTAISSSGSSDGGSSSAPATSTTSSSSGDGGSSAGTASTASTASSASSAPAASAPSSAPAASSTSSAPAASAPSSAPAASSAPSGGSAE
jgi:hypothetical protein